MRRLRFLDFIVVWTLLLVGPQASAAQLSEAHTPDHQREHLMDHTWQTAGTFVETPSVSFSLSEVRLPSLCGSLSPGLDSLALLQSPLLPAPANDLAARLQCRQRLLFPSHYFW